MDKLSKLDKERYFCSTFLKEIKEEGQIKLFNSKVAIVGLGGLGSHVLPILVSSGVGHISIIDNDVVSLDNLPRQTIYGESDVGKSKVKISKKKMNKLNSSVEIITHKNYLTKRNAKKLLSGHDVVIDCTDNFESKFIIDDACLALNIPLVSAGVSDFKGQVLTCLPHKSHDFKSLFSTLPINIEQKYKDEDQGVYPIAVALIGNIAANEAMKYFLNIGELLTDTLLVVDTLSNTYKKIKIV